MSRVARGEGRRSAGSRRPWAVGFLVGLVGGVTALLVTACAIVPVVLVAAVLGRVRPRVAGPAGVVLGFGTAWSMLLANLTVACAASDPPICAWGMFSGTLWLHPAAFWQLDPGERTFVKVLVLMASAAVILVAGIIASLWTARHTRSRLPVEAVPLLPADERERGGVDHNAGWR